MTGGDSLPRPLHACTSAHSLLFRRFSELMFRTSPALACCSGGQLTDGASAEAAAKMPRSPASDSPKYSDTTCTGGEAARFLRLGRQVERTCSMASRRHDPGKGESRGGAACW